MGYVGGTHPQHPKEGLGRPRNRLTPGKYASNRGHAFAASQGKPRNITTVTTITIGYSRGVNDSDP